MVEDLFIILYLLLSKYGGVRNGRRNQSQREKGKYGVLHNCSFLTRHSSYCIVYDVVMKYLLVIAVLLSFAVPAKADVGIKTHDCGEWLSARAKDAPYPWMLQKFLDGFLSGMALGYREEFWASGNGITSDQVFYWMDKYCRENPLNYITKGAIQLFRERTTD